MNPIPIIAFAKFNEVQKYLTLTDHLFAPYVWVVNKDFWASLTDEEKTEVDAGIRDFELQNDGWRQAEIFYEPGGWMARVYQHSWWGHWRVEFYDQKGRNYHYDCQFETEREAEEYAQKWVVSQNRPWG